MGSALGRAGRAATVVADNVELPADVLYEILLRVPPKALCRVRLVCRSWRSLTSDPRFVRAHSSRHPLITGLRRFSHEIHVVDVHTGSIARRMENHAGTFSTPELNLSAQGDLVCFSEATPNMFKSQARVLDPITGVTTALPDGDMETNLSACILGHVPSTGEHKLLRVGNVVLRDGWDIIPTNYQRCEVLTLVTGDDDNAGGGQRWRETSSHPSVTVSLADCRHTAVVDGVIYFLLGGLSLNYFPGVKPDSVVSFDLSTEAWSPTTIRGPLSTHVRVAKLVHSHREGYLQLANLNSCLVMIHHDNPHRSMDIWLLQVNMSKESWTKQYSVYYASLYKHFFIYNLPDPLAVLDGGRVNLPYPLVVLDDGRIVVWFRKAKVLRAYDLMIGTWEDLARLEGYFHVSMYEGSLLRSGLHHVDQVSRNKHQFVHQRPSLVKSTIRLIIKLLFIIKVIMYKLCKGLINLI
jgi:F-box interacting protein